ncbi:MAG: recombinase family protein [Clostridia bacterium]
MANRYLAYGYCISGGQITINETESAVIKTIYKMYANKNSYLKIAKFLTEEKIKYTENKAIWNKNMVARILQNKKYLGLENYPKIIEKEVAERVTCSSKSYTHTMNKDMKQIRSLLLCKCGMPLSRKPNKEGVERWYCPNDINHISINLSDKRILTQVQSLQKTLEYEKPSKSNTLSMELIKLTNKLELLMSEENIDQEAIKICLRAIVTEKYNNLNDVNYREIEIIERLKESDTIDTISLKEVCESIIISGDKVIKINLKKGLNPWEK